MKNLLYVCLLLLFAAACQSNESSKEDSSTPPPPAPKAAIDRFEEEIIALEKPDSAQESKTNAILFTGSSSIRMWENLAEDMEPLPALNYGFGGSTLPEVIHYADRIIFPSKPKLIVLYCGENDISEGATPEEVLASFQQFVQLVRTRLPETDLLYLSMKPSIARWDIWEQYKKGNNLIREFTEDDSKLHYKDVGALMLNSEGKPDPSIFIEDGLHMNESGYARWMVSVKPRVFKLFHQKEEK